MKNLDSQTVSDLIDQRFDPRDCSNVVAGVSTDADLIKCWRDQHLIGDVIRGDVQVIGNCVVSRVAGTLDSEPTILAPVQKPHSETKSSGNEAWKSAGLFAIAASVALMAVLTLSPDNSEFARTGEPSIAALNAVATPVLSDQESLASFELEFGQMMVEHGEFTATSGLNGLLTYAKLVSNDGLGQ